MYSSCGIVRVVPKSNPPPTTMGWSIPASSFQPPAVIRAGARYAPWVLLDRKAYLAVRDNATTAEALTSTGRTVKITFCLADPPAISHFCVHGPEFRRGDFASEPLVVFSAKDLVLLRFAFTVGRLEYFVYKAGRGKPPSLTRIPRTPPGTANSLHKCVLPFDDDDGGFLMADLFMTKLRSDYQLQVFSSKTGKWTITPLRLQTSPGVREEDLPGPRLDKAIALGGGAVGWVDLWRGILTCNVFDKNPVLNLIPIPKLAYSNEERRAAPRLVRDITCCNGRIKFVEQELRFKVSIIPRKTLEDNVDSFDIIFDPRPLSHKEDDDRAKLVLAAVCLGWKLRTCDRHTTRNDDWHKGHTVDMDAISVDNPDHARLLPQLWDAQAGKSTLWDLSSTYPTLGIDDDDIVYMMTKVKFHDNKAWMIGVDLAKRAVEVLIPVSSERVGNFKPDMILACEFSEYLNATASSSQ
ncbi:hypothetical protein CFC21_062879 [Triticum aestivum]|uniref:DUF1618 domain-containing protein n=2 Tax=Triticum aestivum TaxID=4565 RepID=A0A3B6JLG2_WHEAT|nr:uncharacterized protein LOC123100286 [Triticum aestivum]KAF7055335.1 hypothetical protein CFC21_062879 [Triticum aestivum]